MLYYRYQTERGHIMANYRDKTAAPWIRLGIIALLSLVIIGTAFYVSLPPINLHSGEFWAFLFFAAAVVLVLDIIVNGLSSVLSDVLSSRTAKGKFTSLPKRLKYTLIVAGAVIAILIILNIFSSQFLRSGAYSSMIELNEVPFTEALAETEYVSDIALMDSASAQIIGNRTLGSLSDLVSQFIIAENYTQIALESVPYKVAPLEYASFFKWLSNRSDGIPGYVKVDPVNFDAEFVRLSEGEYIRYSPSSYFSKDLKRTLRFKYPTEIFGDAKFEVDEQGRPFWICPTMAPKAGWFGGYDVSGVVILNAVTGDSEKYALGEIPDWVDIVYDGYLICQKYDWYGELSGGYLNYMFSQTGCTATTDDFGYKIIGNDVYIYTGITSLSNDAANIGFILVNSRTGEYQYFPVPGAEEYSAMDAAAGAVQQYGYKASFPSLINVKGEPTYIMVLKDASQIVKMYAMVNVRNYNIVVTAATQDEVMDKYLKAAGLDNVETPEVNEDELKTAELTVKEIHFITVDGNTEVYLKCDDDIICKLPFSADILRLESGDKVSVKYKAEENKNIDGVSFELINE